MCRVENVSCMVSGKYTVYADNHFVGLEIWADGSCILRPTCRTHLGPVQQWSPEVVEGCEAIFQLCSGSTSVEAGQSSHDVTGGSDEACPIAPAKWLQLCQDRAKSLLRKRPHSAQEDESSVPSLPELTSSGMSEEQARYCLAGLQKALQKRVFNRLWDVAMPPMLCKVFSGQGVRVPLPPTNYALPSLPVRAQDMEGVLAPDFKWLQTCNPHPRDEAITFEAAGHVYYERRTFRSLP